MINYIFKTENLSKVFKNNEVLMDVNIELPKGKILGIIGRNGTGKSVFLKTLVGLMKPTHGAVIYQNQVIGKDIEFPKDVNVLLDYDFLPNLSGYNNLKYVSQFLDSVDDVSILDALKLVGLLDDRNVLYKKYSTGMKQKLRIAYILLEKASVYVLDEPFNGLDSSSVTQIRDIIINLNKGGASIILTSHYKEDIELLCNIVYEVKDMSINEVRK